MEFRKPKVFVIGETKIEIGDEQAYLEHIGAPDWYSGECSNIEELSEVYSRSCYKSFGVGLNPNIKQVREGNDTHLKNVIESGHGSVLEHAMVNFMFCDVSRVFTHELVRHRIGVAISQESLRFVRLTELSCFDFPRLEEELTEEEEKWFRDLAKNVFEYLESAQRLMASHFGLDDEKSFAKKKKLTSRMRRLAPLGLLTNIGWSANLRTLRYVIPLRTHKGAEEEIRMVFKEVGRICKEKYPNIFFDMEWVSDGDSTGLGEWQIANRKV